MISEPDEFDSTLAQHALAREHFREVLLAVAVDPRDPEHLARPQLEAHGTQRRLGEVGCRHERVRRQCRGPAAIDGAGAAQFASEQDREFALMALIGRRAGRAYAGSAYAGSAKHHANHGLGPLGIVHRLQAPRLDFARDLT